MSTRPIPAPVFQQAREAADREEYEIALESIRLCLDQLGTDRPVEAGDPDGLSQPQPRVGDAVLLWARCLFQLERHEEFPLLLSLAGKWSLDSTTMAELDVVRLGFAFKHGRYARVVEEASRFIADHRQDLPVVLADFLLLRGHAYSNLGEPRKAQEDAELAYSLFRLLGKEKDCARAANLQGMLKVREADYPQAECWFRRALALHRKLGLRKNMGGNRLNLGVACYKRGDLAQAEIELQAAMALLAEVEARVPLCRAAIARGVNARLQRDWGKARAILTRAYEQANQMMLPREEALALEFLGDVCRDEGKLAGARRYYSRALAIGNSLAPDGDIVAEVMRRQGQVLGELGRHTEAVAVLRRALALARRQGDGYEEGLGHRALARTFLAMGDLQAAKEHSAGSLERLGGVGARFQWAQSQLVHTRVLLARLDGGLLEKTETVLETAWRGTLAALDPFLQAGVEHWIVETRALLADLTRRRALWDRIRRDTAGGRDQETQPIIHVSARMRDLIQMTDAFADSEEPVLIVGATGTGKELFARRLHENSPRRDGNLVCVNVTAIPESMFEREFFGHVRGAFSGAERDGSGLAAQADGGTLFLDEIGELPLELQPRLLRLLQDGTFLALGDPRERRVDVRLVAATNADLETLVREGKFRADLYYRLKILELRLPDIRRRREDILPLMRHFLSRAAGRSVDPEMFFNPESLRLMRQYDWPGNVREIAMVARQARLQLAGTGQVRVEVGRLGNQTLVFTGPRQVAGLAVPHRLAETSQTITRERLLTVLAEMGGNRAAAARRLGISRSTLYRYLERWGIAAKVAGG